MDAFIAWLRATPISQTINSTVWAWPFCETLHFIGLSLLMGTVGFFDLRLMGFFRRVSLASARELMPFAIFGFLLNLVTGLVFLIALPEQYFHNSIWWYKVAFLALAGLNAVVFELTVAKRIGEIGAGVDSPTAAKVIGAVSLLAWLGVLYCGRMLPFLGDAF